MFLGFFWSISYLTEWMFVVVYYVVDLIGRFCHITFPFLRGVELESCQVFVAPAIPWQ